jgi:hypothetical protein
LEEQGTQVVLGGDRTRVETDGLAVTAGSLCQLALGLQDSPQGHVGLGEVWSQAQDFAKTASRLAGLALSLQGHAKTDLGRHQSRPKANGLLKAAHRLIQASSFQQQRSSGEVSARGGWATLENLLEMNQRLVSSAQLVASGCQKVQRLEMGRLIAQDEPAKPLHPARVRGSGALPGLC